MRDLARLHIRGEGGGTGYNRVYFHPFSDRSCCKPEADVGTSVSVVRVRDGYASFHNGPTPPDDVGYLGLEFEVATSNAIFGWR